MSQAATKVRLEDLDIKPYMVAKLKMAGIESVFDLAISIPHQLVDIGGGMLTGTDEHVALELVTKAKKALVDSGLLFLHRSGYFREEKESTQMYYWFRKTGLVSQGRNRDPSNHGDSRGIW